MLIERVSSCQRERAELAATIRLSWGDNHPVADSLECHNEAETDEYLCKTKHGHPIGWFQIRKSPTGAPKRYPSNLYYEVVPERRGIGHGTEILRVAKFLALLEYGEEVVVSAREGSVSANLISMQGGISFRKYDNMEYFCFEVVAR